MNILLLAKKNPYPPNDGEAIAIRQMAKGLSDQNNKVTILYMNTPKHHFDAESIPDKEKLNIKYYCVEVNPKVNITGAVANLFSPLPYHVVRFNSRDFLNKIIILLNEEKYDIIQAEGLFLVQYFKAIRKYSTAKLIYRSHNVEGEIWKNIGDNVLSPLKKIYLKIQSKKLINYEKKIIKTADAILPISVTDALYYSSVFDEKKIKYLPSGIDTNTVDLTNKQLAEVNDIYFLGGLDWLPNIEGLNWFINEIFPKVRKLVPNIKFHIAGRNAPKWLSELNEPGIQFHGEVANAADFIREKFICVVPLLSGSGMKIKIIEAIAAGKYVITTSKAAEGMPGGTEGLIVIADTPQHFAECIGIAIYRKQNKFVNVDAGKQFIISELDNHKLSASLVEFYKFLLN